MIMIFDDEDDDDNDDDDDDVDDADEEDGGYVCFLFNYFCHVHLCRTSVSKAINTNCLAPQSSTS